MVLALFDEAGTGCSTSQCSTTLPSASKRNVPAVTAPRRRGRPPGSRTRTLYMPNVHRACAAQVRRVRPRIRTTYRGGQTRNEWGWREYVERFVVSCGQFADVLEGPEVGKRCFPLTFHVLTGAPGGT